MSEKIYLSAEGRKQLEERLAELNATVIPEAVERLKVAREFGDLSENAEYVTAKENLAKLTAEKENVELKLKFAVEYAAEKGDTVSLGSKVLVYNESLKKEFTYQIVGTAEANIFENKIANESAIGKAILGRKKGETCFYVAPNGKTYNVKILGILS